MISINFNLTAFENSLESAANDANVTVINPSKSSSGRRMAIPESTTDFKDWLEGIKMVARLQDGMTDEFRRKVRILRSK